MIVDKFRRIFRDVRFEIILVAMIFISFVVAVCSLFFYIPWLELANHFFSFLFCTELTIRFLVRSNTRRYWKTFSLDWIASIPWDLLLVLIFPDTVQSMSLLRLLRLPRLFRLLRIISLSRSNVFSRLGYQFKKQLEQSLFRQLFILALVSLSFVLLFSVVFFILGSNDMSESFYFSLISLISSDSIFEVENEPPLYKGLTVFLAFIGIIIFNGIFIAVVVARMTEYMDKIREGVGKVSEKGHYLILGWDSYMPYFFKEMEIYGQNEDVNPSIVVLVESVQDHMQSGVEKYRWIDISFRKGLPYRRNDLETLALHDARAILVAGDSIAGYYEQEAVQIKTFLTLHAIAEQAKKFRPHLLFTLKQEVKEKYLGEFNHCSSDTADLFFYSAKILVSTLVEPRLHKVFYELFSFSGSEFHFLQVPAHIEGLTFRQVQNNIEGCIIAGFMEESRLHMLPSPEKIVNPEMELVILSPSSVQARRSLKKVIPEAHTKEHSNTLPVPEIKPFHAAIIGVNPKLPFIVEELVKLNCGILVIDNQEKSDFENWYINETGRKFPKNAEYVRCDFKSIHEVQKVLPLDRFDRVLVLADESLSEKYAGHTDADTLFKILRIRTLKNETYPDSSFSLLAEVLSADSQEAAELVPQVSFVMGPLILGEILATLVVQPACKQIVRDLVQQGGTNIHLIPLTGKEPLQFGNVLDLYYKTGRLLVGYVRKEAVEINPPRSQMLYPGDQLILLLNGLS